MPERADIPPSEVTPEAVFRNRRFFMKSAIWAGSTLVTAQLYQSFRPRLKVEQTGTAIATVPEAAAVSSVAWDDEPSTFEVIAGYNNFYEFSVHKLAVAEKAKDFQTDPWSLEVGGLVHKPRTFALEDILKIAPVERIYRFRCVEGWSMVVPWIGFPLAKLLAMVEPMSGATHVAFTSYHDLKQMPDSIYAGIDLPYVEGLRLDEAMHPLTLMATGLYGKTLPNQNGAPVRLVVPWKYGFKSIKSVVKIMLTDQQPPTTWSLSNPDEYGFYSNVNPEVPHPRWSQARERRIGRSGTRPTLMFNGYAEQVAGMYAGMDLRKNF
ncbi:MAG: protein-methionine-sulfoxide reductase catalytic subunit MsrP [Prosthecobacter sp.]